MRRAGGQLSGPAKAVGALALLGVALPVNLAVTGTALLAGVFVRVDRPQPVEPQTVLISGGKMTKALALARAFHRAGHRVVLAETAKYRLTGHRFSRAVSAFYSLPDIHSPGYADALVAIAVTEGVDLYVPVCSPAASRYDALAKKALSEHCEVLHLEPELVDRLDDKFAFSRLAASIGVPVPDHHRVTSARDVVDFDFPAGKSYVLKSLAYDPVHRLDLTPLPRPTRAETAAFAGALPITADNPWILQELITGQEYCTHATVRAGHVQIYCCCESSAFQINYAMTDRPKIEDWVRTFLGELGVTGQVAFDFIEAADGTPYAIECNPRTHSAITMFYKNTDVAAAYLGVVQGTVLPRPNSRPTYWLYHEIWRALTRPLAAREQLRVVWRGKDAIFDWSDPLPFLAEHHLQIPWLLVQSLRHRKDFLRIDFNIGKLVEAGGD